VPTTSSGSSGSLPDRVGQRRNELAPAERRVAEFLRQRAHEILLATADEIGELTGTSNATVVRTAKGLGYSGLPELKRAISQALVGTTRPSVRLRRTLQRAGDDTTSLIDHVLAESVERLTETRRLLTEPDFTAALDMITGAREVVGYGVGLTELAARYLEIRLRRLGRRARAVTGDGFRLADDLLALEAGDVVILMAPDRLLPDMEVVIAHARSIGCRVLLISDSLGSVLAGRVDLALTAVQTASGLTQEGVSTMLLLDCLLLGVAQRDPGMATGTSELLNSLRANLSPKQAGRARHA
jgi:DNA-binding MurR/RpiR family transcriptional regulator